MDPVSAIILAMVIAKFFERSAVDITAMITKKDPPSLTYQKAKNPDDKGPLAKMISSWWADAVEDVDEWRRDRRRESQAERDKAREKRRAEREKVIDEARPVPDDIPVEEAPKPEDYEPEPEPRPWDFDPELAEPEPERRWPDPEPERMPEPWGDAELDEKLGEERTGPAVDDTPTPLDPLPPIEPEPVAEVDPIDDLPAGPKVEDFTPEPPDTDPHPPTGGGSTPEDDTEWTPLHPKQPRLYVVPDPTEQEKIMTDANTTQPAVEGGIGTHIRWTAATAMYQDDAKGVVEMVKGMMAGAENGPEVLALAAEIMEGHDILKARYERLNALLVNHKTVVGGAYAATGGQAGNKPYVTGE